MLTYKDYNKQTVNPHNFGIYKNPLATIYHEYAGLVRKSISKVLKNANKNDLDDYVQDFFLEIFRRKVLDKYDVSKASISTFLWKTAENFARNKFQYFNAKKRKHTSYQFDDYVYKLASQYNHGEDLEVDKDSETILNKAFPKLSMREKNVMRFSLDGISPKEISTKTRLPLNEVYKLRSNAFQKTKTVMSNLGY